MSEDFINLEKKPNEKKDIALSVLVLIIIFVFVFGFVTLREYTAKEILSSASQKIVDEVEQMFFSSQTEDEELEEEESITEEEVVIKKTSYTQTAQRGDGLTHLARRAITSYMEEEGVDLSKEERVYVEDYVQKRLAPEKTGLRFLEVGEEIEISLDLIEEGVREAQTLTPYQISNLSYYASLVSF